MQVFDFHVSLLFIINEFIDYPCIGLTFKFMQIDFKRPQSKNYTTKRILLDQFGV